MSRFIVAIIAIVLAIVVMCQSMEQSPTLTILKDTVQRYSDRNYWQVNSMAIALKNLTEIVTKQQVMIEQIVAKLDPKPIQ